LFIHTTISVYLFLLTLNISDYPNKALPASGLAGYGYSTPHPPPFNRFSSAAHLLLPLVLRGPDHQFRPDQLVKVLLAQGLQLHGRLLQGQALLVRVLGYLAGHVVADLGVEASNQHESVHIHVSPVSGYQSNGRGGGDLRFLNDACDLLLVRLETNHQVLLKAAHAIAQDPDAVKQVSDHQGLEHVQFELSVHATDGCSSVVADDLRTDHSQSLTLSWVDLSGHDGASRLVFGQGEFTQSATRTGTEVSDVLGDLEQGRGEGVQRAGCLDDGVMRGQGFELVGGGLELGAGHLADFRSNGLGEALVGVDSGTNCSSSLGKETEVWKGGFHSLDAEVELRNVS